MKSETEIVKSDIEIAQAARLLPIGEIAEKLGLREEDIIPYGRNKAKIDLAARNRHPKTAEAKLVLVTAMSPTPAGEGKSTVTVGLAQALNKVGKRAIAALREPSLGPNFGLKGGAAGGGYSQVVPMEDINLHFTGDFHAITTAHNLLAAVIDNHLYQGNALNLDPARVVWRRVLDMNDRALRQIVIGLGGRTNGVTRESGFDITVASEIMAILCLVEDLKELKEALGKILIGYTYDKQPIYVRDLHVEGAMAAVLKDAIHPNLVQTLENTPALIHGGPFANIAHGCNSLTATRMALTLGEYVVTEAGFGSDLGAEKFFDIKCRKGDLHPNAAVIVATVRALKYHGGVARRELGKENLDAIAHGFANLEHHVRIVERANVPFVIALNRFTSDTEAEIEFVQTLCKEHGFPVAVTNVWAEGGNGGVELARSVISTVENSNQTFHPIYELDGSIQDKIEAVCRDVYEADGVVFTDEAKRQMAECERNGWDELPVCMAKTQYSFSDNAKAIGDVKGFTITIREIRPSLGAGFLVCLTGDIMTMPGLPKEPTALKIDIHEDGSITGLF
ncbi:formate--tetrahydrofolate ligase [Alicyclobacillus ferrooxydans]|uniref:Formate--tetrahydrofolate ligase n=1 Tax=Alicyclobacillus ferrooxydans TaxID=471514 RepID=A0A0P9CFM2_9BACL|nr:formate--tetrahydrofolate ligase [Alicyclobacillus ferrooxydans]KPV44591.1 formate--tetrahydrofolate ligase [Alicyclobacillus ferrooxydans]